MERLSNSGSPSVVPRLVVPAPPGSWKLDKNANPRVHLRPEESEFLGDGAWGSVF